MLQGDRYAITAVNIQGFGVLHKARFLQLNLACSALILKRCIVLRTAVQIPMHHRATA